MTVLGTMTAGAQPRSAPDISAMLLRIGERVQEYYARALSVVCLESVSLRQLGTDLTSDGSPVRRLVFELRIGWQPPASGTGPPEASVLRQIVTIDGRPPRPKDKPGCMDPKSVSPEPLAMLLPDHQHEYAFRWAGTTRMNGRAVAMLDYRARAAAPAEVKWRDDCVSIELPGQSRGRVWADQSTGEVLRLDESLAGMFEFRVPNEYQRMGGAPTMLIERADTSIRYRPVTFRDPDETLMLPASVETLQVIRNSGAPRVRKTQVFSKYRRFVTEGRVVE
jgi:hypothetical protein